MSKRNEKCHRERIACPMAIFFAFGDFDFLHAVRFWKQVVRLRRGETPAAHGAVNSSSMPFALIVSGRRSIHTAIISTDA